MICSIHTILNTYFCDFENWVGLLFIFLFFSFIYLIYFAHCCDSIEIANIQWPISSMKYEANNVIRKNEPM